MTAGHERPSCSAEHGRPAGLGDRPAVLHVGYLRTSTTKHQRDLFLHHKDIAYLGKPYPTPVLMDLVYRVTGADSAFYDPASSRQVIENVLRETIVPNGRVVLLSDEVMLSRYSGDIGRFCRRMKNLFGDPKVMIVIRRQDELLLSWLFHEIKKPYRFPLKENLETVETEMHQSTSLLHHLDYAPICRTFAEVLGRDNLLVIPYELFKNDCRRYAQTLSDFMGIDADETYERLREGRVRNARQPRNKVAYYDFKQRYLPRWSESSLARFADLALAKLFLVTGMNARCVDEIEAKARTLCAERYAESNRTLSREFGLDLESFGYPGL